MAPVTAEPVIVAEVEPSVQKEEGDIVFAPAAPFTVMVMAELVLSQLFPLALVLTL